MCSDYLDKINHFALYRDVPSLAIRRPLVENPRVSVIVPTYNRAALLAETLDSILAQQGFDVFEIVVVDNNPERDDATEKLIARYEDPRIAYFKNKKNIGMFGNWNRAIELSRGEWIAMIHDDDLLLPAYLATVMRLVSRAPDIGLLAVDSEWRRFNPMVATGRRFSLPTPGSLLKSVAQKLRCAFRAIRPLQKLSLKDYVLSYPHTTPGWFFRRDMALALGGFDPKHSPCSDYYFSAKCCWHSHVYRFRRRLFVYRWGENESVRLETRLGFVRNDTAFRLFLVDRLGVLFKRWSIYCVCLDSAIRTRLTVPELSGEQLRTFLSGIGVGLSDVTAWDQWAYFHCWSRLFRFSLLLSECKK